MTSTGQDAGSRRSTDRLWTQFRTPPPDARPMVRWWWFGGAVEPEGIVREIRTMKRGGFGGFEIQPVYPLSLDDETLGVTNRDYLSEPFLDALRTAARTAREERMRLDLTLGSGWPFGGPHIPAEHAASCLLRSEHTVPPGTGEFALPTLPEAHRPVAAFLSREDSDRPEPVEIGADGILRLAPANAERRLTLIVQGRTGQQVKRATVGAEGYVLDHLSSAALERHLEAVGAPLLAAFGPDRPYAVFSDSLESYGSDWTDDLLDAFAERRGYDLKPYLHDLFVDTAHSAGIRHDWGLTLTELVNERYLIPMSAWAARHQTVFRSQTYGYPPVTLSSNRHVDLAEGEGAEWRSFSTCRWASSANHLYGRKVTSAEAWTWLAKGAFRATPLDIKAETDVHLLSGVNHFIAHGWPYSPPDVPEPGWAFYAAAVFNDRNPFWPVMAEVNRYIQRLSHLLRLGENVADIAIYLPTEDVLSGLKPAGPSPKAGEGVSIDKQFKTRFAGGLIPAILDAGYNFDFIDAEAVLNRGIGYRILLLPDVERIIPAVYERIRDFADGGGIVVALGAPPRAAPGFEADAASALVGDTAAALFEAGRENVVVTDEAGLPEALAGALTPDLAGLVPGLGFVHRRAEGGDVYFVANTTNAPVNTPLRFRVRQALGQSWDPVAGTARAFVSGLPVALAPYESRVFVFGPAAAAPAAATPTVTPKLIALDTGWRFALGPDAEPGPLGRFASWADTEAGRHHSGVGRYSLDIELGAEDAEAVSAVLDFGQGAPSADPERSGPGMSARLDAPLRDAAEIFVNGERAGAVWCAPFCLEIGPFLREGANSIEIRVYNTAINLLSGRPPADYTALEQRYGRRFEAQNMDDLEPLPSGILAAPVLRVTPAP